MGSDPLHDVTIWILAGGKSVRMGHDKAFVEFEGQTLLSRMLDLARSVGSNVYIVGNAAKFAGFAAVVEDVFPECGPLGGIHAALLGSTNDLNLMLAVDMPLVSREFLQYLVERARSAPEADVIIPRSDGRWQPLCAIYRRQFATRAEKALRSGRNRIDLLLNTPTIRGIEQSEWEDAGFTSTLFQNLNTPEELQAQKASK